MKEIKHRKVFFELAGSTKPQALDRENTYHGDLLSTFSVKLGFLKVLKL